MKHSRSLISKKIIAFAQRWSKEDWSVKGHQCLSYTVELLQTHSIKHPESPLFLSIQEGCIRAYLFPELWMHKATKVYIDTVLEGNKGIRKPKKRNFIV